MLRIFNNIGPNVSQVFHAIGNGLLDYVPGDKFREVTDIQDADIVLMHGSINSHGALGINITNAPVTLKNIGELADYYTGLEEKHRIIYLDVMGPSLHTDPDLFDPVLTGIRETDVIISLVSVPDRPNIFRDVSHLEKGLFRSRERFERVPGSVALIGDHIFHNSTELFDPVETIKGVIGDVSHLHISGGQIAEDQLVEVFGASLSKVTSGNLSWPQGIAYRLSQVEFCLNMHTYLGVEMMGVEAGLCGCQPIYPDTEFYRDLFDGTGVVFFDVANPVDSLRAIIKEGSKFDKETTEAFRTKFSAEDTLPKFWEQVYELYSE